MPTDEDLRIPLLQGEGEGEVCFLAEGEVESERGPHPALPLRGEGIVVPEACLLTEGEVKYARGSSDSGSRLFDLIEQTSLGKAGSLTRSGERSEASGL